MTLEQELFIKAKKYAETLAELTGGDPHIKFVIEKLFLRFYKEMKELEKKCPPPAV